MFTKKTSRKACKGFSLIELLLVLSLAPIVFFAVYSNFSVGIRLWQRIQVDTPEEDLALFFIKAQNDFSNVIRYSSLPFTGDDTEFTFTAGIEAPLSLGGERAIGEVRYFYDESSRGIAREVRDFSQIHKEKPGKTSLLLRRVDSFEVAYLVWDPLSSQYEWMTEFHSEKPDGLPVAVRLLYSAQGTDGPAEQTFFLSAGGAKRLVDKRQGLPAGRQGSMLVLALWTLSLLGLFSVSLGFGVRQKAALLSRLSTLDALYPIAYSGVEQAKSLVRSDGNFDVDTRADTWATGSRKTNLQGGVFSLVTDTLSPVVDEERKVNLNHTSVEITSRLLRRVSGLGNEEADGIAYNLIDWMDSDPFFGHPQYGAEDSYYENLPKPYSAKDAPYEVLDELLLVKDMTPEIFAKIKPYVTVYGSGQVNLNTADGEVLAALGFSPLGVETITQYRAGEDGKDGTADDRFFTNVSNVETDLSQRGRTPLDGSQAVMLSGLVAAGRVGVASSAFSVTSLGVLERNDASLRIEATFDRKSRVLYQRVGEVQWPNRS